MLIRFAELLLVFRYLRRAENFYFKINVVVIVHPAAGNFTILADVPSGVGTPAKRPALHPGPSSIAAFKRHVHMHAPFDFFEVYTMNSFQLAGKQFAIGVHFVNQIGVRRCNIYYLSSALLKTLVVRWLVRFLIVLVNCAGYLIFSAISLNFLEISCLYVSNNLLVVSLIVSLSIKAA